MRRMFWLIITSIVASTVILSANIMFFHSSIIGGAASILFIGSSSIVIGKLFYAGGSKASQSILSVSTLLVFLSLIGTVLILIGKFSETATIIAVIAMTLSLTTAFVFYDKRHSREVQVRSSEKNGRNVDFRNLILSLPFLLSVSVAFWLLWASRSGDGGSSVWLLIPSSFTWVFLMSGLFLGIILFLTDIHLGVKLAFACVFSFLAHSLLLLVLYPGEYGDQWSHLGESRYIAKTGMPYAYSYLLQNSLWVDIVKFRTQHSLVIFFDRMFYIDIYWVHVLLVPILWSVLTPLLAFKIGETLSLKRSKAFPLLTAMMTVALPSLVGWGAVSVPNSVGFIFFFIETTLLLLWMREGGKRIWLVALLAAVASFFAHPQPGSFAFIFLFCATVLRKTSKKLLWVAAFPIAFTIYPVALRLHGASYAPLGLLQISNFLAFQSEVTTILLIFALVGLVLGIRRRFVDSKASLLVFVSYVFILVEYYFTKYGMSNLPFGPSRILVMADFLLVPLVATGFLTLIAPLREKRLSSSLFSRKVNLDLNPRILGLSLIVLFLSFYATSALYQAYPQTVTEQAQPSAYELEAMRYIDANSPSKYVVLCEPGFASLANGFLGKDYGYLGGGKGLFGIADWGYPTIQMYLEMTRTPSIGILQQALSFAKAEFGYFVVSVRNPDFDEIVKRTSEILPVNNVFGDGRLYVFMYPLPLFEEPGVPVKVVFDDGIGGEENLPTTLAYMVENEITATLTVTGYTSYNVTDFPQNWTFLDLMVNNVSRQFDGTSNINTFIYAKGLEQNDALTVKWLFNRRYPNVGWKEDSFKGRMWQQGPYYSGITPIIIADGNVLSISHSFLPGSIQDYYYSTTVNISTNDYPYLLMRWRSDQPVAVAAVYYDLGGVQEIVRLGSSSPEWSTIVVPLQLGNIVHTVMVGFSNARNQRLAGPANVEIDYILFGAKATS